MSSGYYLTSSFFYFNMGAHMIYILRNRLEAQKIKNEKMKRILQQIAQALFQRQYVEGILPPQQPFNISSLKEVFQTMAHSSVMKLDQNSMDKLFYLMVMTIKRQFVLLSSPYQLYTLTLTQMLNLAKLLSGTTTTKKISYAVEEFQKAAKNYSFIQYLEIRSYLLSELQSYQTRIANFIQVGSQTPNGKLLFFLRNSHNQKSLGTALNQKDLQLPHIIQPQNQLFYENWTIWKTNLVIDYNKQYNKMSQQRLLTKKVSDPVNIQYPQQQIEEKSLKKMLLTDDQRLGQYEVKFSIFESEQSSKMDNVQKAQNMKTLQKSKQKNQMIKNQKSEMKKIQQQFGDLNLQTGEDNEEDQIDLLEVMDS